VTLAVARPIRAVAVRVLAAEGLAQQRRPLAYAAALRAAEQHLALVAVALAACCSRCAAVVGLVGAAWTSRPPLHGADAIALAARPRAAAQHELRVGDALAGCRPLPAGVGVVNTTRAR
jgi:hypothetical protein